jgi:uncharacterized membrane protein YbhN (UPF0104 family)
VLPLLARIDLRWVAVLVLVLVAYVMLRSLRWWLVAGAGAERLRFGPLCAGNVVGIALGSFSPMQAGELAKVELAARRTGIGRIELAAMFVLERLLDTVVVAAMFGIGLATSLAGKLALDPRILWLALALVLPALAVVAFACRRWPEPARRVAGRLRAVLAHPGRLLVAFALTLASWACVVVAWVVSANCFDIELGAGLAMALIGAVTFVRLATLVPGGIGVDEAGIVGLMLLVGHPAERAQAFAIGSRIIDLILLSLALAVLPWLRRPIEPLPRLETSPPAENHPDRRP